MRTISSSRVRARQWFFLQTYGVSASLALKISKVYGERTQAVIRANPYQLCDDIDGVGFKTADAIGTAIGIPPDSDGANQRRAQVRPARSGSEHGACLSADG